MITGYLVTPTYMKYVIKLHFEELLILGEYYQCDWKISPKWGRNNHEYIEYI